MHLSPVTNVLKSFNTQLLAFGGVYKGEWEKWQTFSNRAQIAANGSGVGLCLKHPEYPGQMPTPPVKVETTVADADAQNKALAEKYVTDCKIVSKNRVTFAQNDLILFQNREF